MEPGAGPETTGPLPLFPGLAAPDPDAGARQGRADAPLPPAERRLRAWERAKAGAVWTLGSFAEAFHVSKATAGNDLRALAEEGRLQPLGNRRSLRYVLAEDAGDTEK